MDARRIFAALDRNQDQGLDKHELTVFLKRIDKSWTEERLGRLFRVLDTDGNGAISLNEFTSWCFGHKDIKVGDMQRFRESVMKVPAVSKKFLTGVDRELVKRRTTDEYQCVREETEQEQQAEIEGRRDEAGDDRTIGVQLKEQQELCSGDELVHESCRTKPGEPGLRETAELRQHDGHEETSCREAERLSDEAGTTVVADSALSKVVFDLRYTLDWALELQAKCIEIGFLALSEVRVTDKYGEDYCIQSSPDGSIQLNPTPPPESFPLTFEAVKGQVSKVVGRCPEGHVLKRLRPEVGAWVCHGSFSHEGCQCGRAAVTHQTKYLHRFSCETCRFSLCQTCCESETWQRLDTAT
eukprot:TRINITY_DN108080_c0_g1_i1.p1 TRINITY_DN108080_c0_g1~~TRINITY_DN108080_c0_g1_i1.p1  ORF type:complete len:355 (-),score=56.89 TRINITY_DN108080_c0_g1_i1:172-1236(-)